MSARSPRKRNMQDATLINIRALRGRITRLERRVSVILKGYRIIAAKVNGRG